MIFNKYKSYAEFLRTDLSEKELLDIETEFGYNKYIMKHPNCPEQIFLKYENSKIWYERLVAFLTKSRREQGIEKALKDPDSRVRRAGLNAKEYCEAIKGMAND